MPEEIMLWKKQVQIIIFKLKEGPPWARVPKVRRKISFRVKSCAVERILFSLSESEKEKREPASVGGAAPPPQDYKGSLASGKNEVFDRNYPPPSSLN